MTAVRRTHAAGADSATAQRSDDDDGDSGSSSSNSSGNSNGNSNDSNDSNSNSDNNNYSSSTSASATTSTSTSDATSTTDASSTAGQVHLLHLPDHLLLQIVAASEPRVWVWVCRRTAVLAQTVAVKLHWLVARYSEYVTLADACAAACPQPAAAVINAVINADADVRANAAGAGNAAVTGAHRALQLQPHRARRDEDSDAP
ncbi:hypothetical protein GQ42DRAFT_6140, partial [Ramicandelaber brevisporus]